MKIKCLIVDDEPIICRGLRETIPWGDLQVEIVGEAYDGLEALGLIEELDVNLVISDIKMPNMDGLELAETIFNSNLPVKIILISGFEEFEYARQAMKFGVQHYLLKPVDIDDLLSVVKKISNLLNDEQHDKQHEMIEQIFRSIQLDIPVDSLLLAKFREIVDQSNYAIILSQFDDYVTQFSGEQNRADLLKQELITIIDSHLNQAGFTSFSNELHSNLLGTVCLFNEPTFNGKVLDALKMILEQWPHHEKIVFGVSKSKGKIDHFSDTYHEALTNLFFKVVSSEPILIQNDLNRPPLEYPTECEKDIIGSLFLSKEKVQDAVDRLFEFFIKKGFILNEISQMLDEIMLMVGRRLRGIGVAESFEKVNLYTYNSIKSLKEYFLEFMFGVLKVIESMGNHKIHWLIQKAKSYINEHFNEDIKQIDVANYVHVTPNYLSVLFKQDVDQGFNEYLNGLRVEHAKRLLTETSKKVYEITEAIGYKEYKYFVSIFKKVTGVTPSEYRSNQAKK